MTRLTEAFIDANLLVLLVVGSVDRRLVARHRRTRTFLPEDYDRLVEVIQDVQVFVTPNTLTEASNHLEAREDTRFLEQLRRFIWVSTRTTLPLPVPNGADVLLGIAEMNEGSEVTYRSSCWACTCQMTCSPRPRKGRSAVPRWPWPVLQ